MNLPSSCSQANQPAFGGSSVLMVKPQFSPRERSVNESSGALGVFWVFHKAPLKYRCNFLWLSQWNPVYHLATFAKERVAESASGPSSPPAKNDIMHFGEREPALLPEPGFQAPRLSSDKPFLRRRTRSRLETCCHGCICKPELASASFGQSNDWRKRAWARRTDLTELLLPMCRSHMCTWQLVEHG